MQPQARLCDVPEAVPVTTSWKSPLETQAATPVSDATAAAFVQAVPAPAQAPAVRRSRFSVLDVPSV